MKHLFHSLPVSPWHIRTIRTWIPSWTLVTPDPLNFWCGLWAQSLTGTRSEGQSGGSRERNPDSWGLVFPVTIGEEINLLGLQPHLW